MQCVLQLRVMKVLMKHALANDVDVNQHQTVKPAAMLSAILTTSDTGPAPAAPPSVVGATRKLRWLCISADGSKGTVQADKRTLISKFELGIPIRDMRLLDSTLVTSSRGYIAVRENAIVFAIDYVRLIIAADRVIIPQDGFDQRPQFHDFVKRLLGAIVGAAAARQRREEAVNAASGPGSEQQMQGGGDDSEDVKALFVDPEASPSAVASMVSEAHSYASDLLNQPFEMTALEVALKEICQSYAQSEKQLEALINPACDALLKKVTTATLENLRRLKTRHQRLLSQVTTMRQELEDFLKDDDDMAKMCLSRKRDQAAQWAAASNVQGSSPTHGLSRLGSQLRRTSMVLRAQSFSPGGGGGPFEDSFPEASAAAAAAAAVQDAEAAADAEANEEVENLLESYFVQIDRTYNRLKSLQEFMGDTEDYINIDLDSSQNRLFRLDIVLTGATFSIAIFEVFAGILGENVPIPERLTTSQHAFWLSNGATFLLTCFVFLSLNVYLSWRRLLL